MPLHLVSTPIGNLADITLRALETLREADVVYAEDTRRTGRLLRHHGIDAPLRSLHEHNERGRTDEILARLEAGESLVLVSDAGTPLVADPGYPVVAAAASGGFPVVPVPGASAVITALTASGLPTDRFTFLGFVPRKAGARTEVLERVACASETVVLYEAPGRLLRLLRELQEHIEPERPIVVARELTKLHEEFVRGTVSDALERFAHEDPRGEITLVIGPAPTEATPASPEAIRTFVERCLERGERRKEIVAQLVDEFGLARNDAYRRAHDPQFDA